MGLLAGHVVNLLKKMPVHRYVRPIMPILIIPIVSGLVVGMVMLKVVGVPIAHFMTFLGTWLQAMSGGNAVVLAMILGAMIAFDMGGPVNKAAFFFGAAMIKEGNFAMMGACAAAICTPPLGLALATFFGRRLWTAEQKESGIAALGMGMVGITEGAIPFAAGDPCGLSRRSCWARWWPRSSRCSAEWAIMRLTAGRSSCRWWTTGWCM